MPREEKNSWQLGDTLGIFSQKVEMYYNTAKLFFFVKLCTVLCNVIEDTDFSCNQRSVEKTKFTIYYFNKSNVNRSQM